MKYDIKKYMLFLLVMLLCGISNVCAEDKKDNVTYTVKFDSNNYEYGNVTDCTPYSGTAYRVGLKSVSGKKMYVFNIEDPKIYSLKCDDKDMESYMTDIKGSDGNTYYAFGCRKPKKDSVIEYFEKEIYVGYSVSVGDWATSTCSIMEGNSVTLSSCSATGVKAGVTKIKSKSKGGSIFYYKVNVKKGYKSISELDKNYNYGSVDKCELGSKGYTYGEKVTFDGLEFCGSPLPGYEFEMYEVTCKKDGYESFALAFDSGEKHYKGYGCRKLKKTEEAEDSIEYIKRDIYLGQKENIANYYDYTCSVISGESGTVTDHCELTASKIGTIRIKAIHNTSSLATYYEYNVIKAPEDVTELDDSYQYDSIKECSIYVQAGYSGSYVEKEITVDGIKFCGSKAKHQDVSATVKCPSQYDVFQLVLKSGEEYYYSYGCRKNPNVSTQTPNTKPDIIPDNVCNTVPEILREYILDALKLIRWIGLVAMIILGVLDFTKAVASDDQDALKKAWGHFTKRLIAVIILFILPLLVELILDLVGIKTCSM